MEVRMSWWGIGLASFLQLPAAWGERKVDNSECLMLLNAVCALKSPSPASTVLECGPNVFNMSP